MKRGLLLLLLASSCFADGPLFRQKDTFANQEFENVYQDLRNARSLTATAQSSADTAETDAQSAITLANATTHKVLQVVSGNTSTPHSETTASYSDTGLTASLTTVAANSTILVFVAQEVAINAPGTGTNICGLKLLRGSTGLVTTPVLVQAGATPTLNEKMVSLVYSDSASAAAGSSLTYKTQIANVGATATSVIANNNPASNASTSYIVLVEIGS